MHSPDSPPDPLVILSGKVRTALRMDFTRIIPFDSGSHHNTFLAYPQQEVDKILIVRLHNPRFANSFTLPYKMKSEIATLQYLRSNTNVPVPQVYFHDQDSGGEVGGEWMVTEYMSGYPLVNIWPSLSLQQREHICVSVADVWTSILSITFTKIGSIHADTETQTSYIGPMSRLPSSNAYTIGVPDVTKCGPFLTPQSWLQALANRDLEYISSYPEEPLQPQYIAECNAFIDSASIPDGPANAFVLEHIDFTPHNIMVIPPEEREDGMPKITSVIDWEGARVVPMWATNCGWIWPQSSPEEEQTHLGSLIRERIGSNIPEWFIAMGDTYRDARIAYQWAVNADWDPPTIVPHIERRNVCRFYVNHR